MLRVVASQWRHSSCQLASFWRHRWPEALAIADDHMARYPPAGLKQPNLDTHHLAEKVAMLVRSKVRHAPPSALLSASEGPAAASVPLWTKFVSLFFNRIYPKV